uniref:Uncharacterized protein n=1 Tax=Anopheles farauti TaxID=69004 RepID=A0A182QI12_9DIPT
MLELHPDVVVVGEAHLASRPATAATTRSALEAIKKKFELAAAAAASADVSEKKLLLEKGKENRASVLSSPGDPAPGKPASAVGLIDSRECAKPTKKKTELCESRSAVQLQEMCRRWERFPSPAATGFGSWWSEHEVVVYYNNFQADTIRAHRLRLLRVPADRSEEQLDLPSTFQRTCKYLTNHIIIITPNGIGVRALRDINPRSAWRKEWPDILTSSYRLESKQELGLFWVNQFLPPRGLIHLHTDGVEWRSI